MDIKEYIDKTIHKPHKSHLKGSFSFHHISTKDLKEIGVKKALFEDIIESVFDEIIVKLLNGEKVRFPFSMGEVEVNSYRQKQSIINGEYRSNNHIDWKSTLELWYEDEESRNKKTFVRYNNRTYYKLFYNNHNAKFKNKNILRLYTSQYMKQKIKEAVDNNTINVFER